MPADCYAVLQSQVNLLRHTMKFGYRVFGHEHYNGFRNGTNKNGDEGPSNRFILSFAVTF
jgi:hypothetical protein